ncbi:MAG: thioredoxin family protein [Anaerolineales bacterium]
MITIKVFGPTPACANCKRAEREALKAAEQFPGQVQVVKLDALGPEAMAYSFMATPAIALDDTLLASGRVLRAEELVARIRERIGG